MLIDLLKHDAPGLIELLKGSYKVARRAVQVMTESGWTRAQVPIKGVLRVGEEGAERAIQLVYQTSKTRAILPKYPGTFARQVLQQNEQRLLDLVTYRTRGMFVGAGMGVLYGASGDQGSLTRMGMYGALMGVGGAALGSRVLQRGLTQGKWRMALDFYPGPGLSWTRRAFNAGKHITRKVVGLQ